ncbi:MAG: LuxR C-terminal-related transcriptional regulator [Thermoleophilia bacterium]
MPDLEEQEKSQKAVLESKLRPPRLRNVLERPRLLKQQESGGAPRVINICAGPGFGKTTLMAQMAREFSGNRIWYQVDGLDRDPAVFLRHMISGFSHACGFDGTRARSRLGDVTDFSTESESVLAVLLDELGEHSQAPLMLCFDDYHLFNDAVHASRLVEYLIKNLPEQSCIAITTRNYPELSLGRLRSQSALLDLKDEDLQFSLDELSRLTDTWDIHVSATALEKVYKSTEGWPAGMVLSESFLRSGSEMPDLFSHRRMQQNVYEYLAEEVLNNQPADMQELLIRVALIDPVDPVICEAALNVTGVSEMLAEAEQRNLFTSRLDDSDLFRYHPLFRDFLLSRMVIQAGKEELNNLRVSFAEAFIAAGNDHQAIELYLAAGQLPPAMALIEKIGDEMLNTAEYATLEKWIDTLNEDELTPALQIQRARILMSVGKFRRALNIFMSVQSRLDANDIEQRLQFSFAFADCLNELGNYSKAIDVLKELLELPLTLEMHQEVIYQMAASCFIGFDQKGLKSCLEKATALNCDSSRSITQGCKFILIMQNLRCGNFSEALRLQKRYLDYENLSESQSNLYINNMASCLMMVGNYVEARSYAEKCVQKVEKQQEIKTIPVALDTLGCLMFAEGDYKEGEQLLMRALQISSQLEQKRGDTMAAIKCHLGTWARRRGKPNIALKLHRESLEVANHTNEIYEIAMSKVNIMADLIQVSNFEEAETVLVDVRYLSTKYKFGYVQTAMDFSLAWAAHLMDDTIAVQQHLKTVLKRSKELQHNHWLVQEGNNSIPLFKTALENSIEVDYVCWILEKIGENSLSAIEPALNHNDPIIREKIASLLCRIGSAGALTLLRRMRYDSNEFVQKTVTDSLTKIRRDIKNPSEILTIRESEVLKWLARGLSNNQIAQKLYISDCTVKTHVVKIFRKMGFTNRIDAALYFQQQAEKNTTFYD